MKEINGLFWIDATDLNTNSGLQWLRSSLFMVVGLATENGENLTF